MRLILPKLWPVTLKEFERLAEQGREGDERVLLGAKRPERSQDRLSPAWAGGAASIALEAWSGRVSAREE